MKPNKIFDFYNNEKIGNRKMNHFRNEIERIKLFGNKNKIRQGNKDLLENQKSFQNYIRDQNQAYKTIENSLIDINNKSRDCDFIYKR